MLPWLDKCWFHRPRSSTAGRAAKSFHYLQASGVYLTTLSPQLGMSVDNILFLNLCVLIKPGVACKSLSKIRIKQRGRALSASVISSQTSPAYESSCVVKLLHPLMQLSQDNLHPLDKGHVKTIKTADVIVPSEPHSLVCGWDINKLTKGMEFWLHRHNFDFLTSPVDTHAAKSKLCIVPDYPGRAGRKPWSCYDGKQLLHTQSPTIHSEFSGQLACPGKVRNVRLWLSCLVPLFAWKILGLKYLMKNVTSNNSFLIELEVHNYSLWMKISSATLWVDISVL